MKNSEFTSIPLKIKNEDGGMQLLVQEYEVTREIYKGHHHVTSKYVTIFVPRSIGQADSDIESAVIADYHERGYSVNVMYSGSKPLKGCMYDLLHNNRNTEPPDNDGDDAVKCAAGYRLGDRLVGCGKRPPKVIPRGIEKPQSLSLKETKEGQLTAMCHAGVSRDDLLAALGVEPPDEAVHPMEGGAGQ